MIDMKKIIVCFCILNVSYAYSNKNDNINEDVEQEDLDEIDDNAEQENTTEESNTKKQNDNKNKQPDNKSQERKNNKAVGGWYSGLDVKYVQPKLEVTETKSDNTSESYKTKSNLISPSMTLGYDFLLDKLILGGECNVAFNFGSPMDYKSKNYNQNIAKITKGINFIGAVKIGVALGSVIVYGKVGGDLSKWKYDWKLDDKNNIEKKYKANMLYGGGIEKQFMNRFYMRAEFSYNPNITHEDTKKTIKDCKISDVNINNYQISIGGGYRF